MQQTGIFIRAIPIIVICYDFWPRLRVSSTAPCALIFRDAFASDASETFKNLLCIYEDIDQIRVRKNTGGEV